MKFRRRALAAVAFVVVGTLTIAAQQPAIAKLTRPVAGATYKTGLSKVPANAFTTIQGNALTSTNGPLNEVTVRLRDARFGHIVSSQFTDKSGQFAFKGVEPGSYIVEVIANEQTVVAASQLLNVNGGEAVSAVVKLPFRIPPFAGLLGNSTTPSAGAIAMQAAASGIAAIVPTVPISPNQ